MLYKTLPFLTVMLFIAACTKSTERNHAAGWEDGNSAGSIEVRQFLNKKAPVAQSFMIDPTLANTVVTKGGISFTIPANNFYSSGVLVTKPPVTIEISEYFTNKDLLTSNVSTATNDGQILNTGGAFNITAAGNHAEPLTIGNFITVKVPVKGTYNPSYMTFTGIDNGATMTVNDAPNRVIWNKDSVNDMRRADSNYQFVLKTLSWCNVDQYLKDLGQGYSMMNVKLPAKFGNSNSMVALIFPNNGVVRLLGDPISETFISAPYKLPVGLSLKLICIAKVNGAYFYDYRPVTIAKTNTFTIPVLQPITETDLANFIDNNLY